MHVAIRKQGKSCMLAAIFGADDITQLLASGVDPLSTYWEIDGDCDKGLTIRQSNSRQNGRKMQRELGQGDRYAVYFRPGPLGAKQEPVRKAKVKAQIRRGFVHTEPLGKYFKPSIPPMPRDELLSEKSVAGMTPMAKRQPVLDDLHAAVQLVNEAKKALPYDIKLEVESDGYLSYSVKHKPMPKGNPQLKAVK